MARTCKSASGCDRPAKVFGYCTGHYKKLRAGGDPNAALRQYGVERHMLPPPRVEPEVHQAIERMCKEEGISSYEFVIRLIHDWYQKDLEHRKLFKKRA